MAQIFPPSTNTFAKVTIFGAVFFLAGLAWVWGEFSRSSYVTEVNVVRNQVVPFSHDHHVSGLGIDCRYCHTSVEKSSFAGIPATEICMGCHSQIWRSSPMLEPVRASYRTGEPLRWTRVYDLPDFVYFDHSIHVAKGVGCESCHGRVDQMPLVRKASSLHMEWCLECHREPQKFVRAKDEIFQFGLAAKTAHTADRDVVARELVARDLVGHEPAARDLGIRDRGSHSAAGSDATAQQLPPRDLVAHYGIAEHQLTNCSICHR